MTDHTSTRKVDDQWRMVLLINALNGQQSVNATERNKYLIVFFSAIFMLLYFSAAKSPMTAPRAIGCVFVVAAGLVALWLFMRTPTAAAYAPQDVLNADEGRLLEAYRLGQGQQVSRDKVWRPTVIAWLLGYVFAATGGLFNH